MKELVIKSGLLLLGQGLGLEYMSILLLSLGFSVLFGFMSIFAALLKGRGESTWIAWVCILISLGTALAFLVLVENGLTLEGYITCAFPSVLGFIALALNRLYGKQKPSQEGQFSLIALFVVITAVAVLLGMLTIAR